MKKILFIAYYFPPMAGAGVQKSLKFVKYLRDYDYEPIVLTVNPRWTRWLKDYTLLTELPAGLCIFRTPTLDWNWIFKLLWGLRLHRLVSWLQRHWLLPDPEKTWLPFAKKRLREIVKEHDIALTYISGSPFSSFCLGKFAQDRYGIPYVLDFRDEWTNNPTRLASDYPVASLIRETRLEETLLKECSGIVYTIPSYMRENFEQKYPFIKQKFYRIITNGYDESDFAGLGVNDQSVTDHLRIVYTGTFYDHRNPDMIWKALQSLYETGVVNPSLIKFELIGKNTQSFVLGHSADSPLIRQTVEFKPNLSHQAALRELLSADVLLLFITPGKNAKAELTGKIFEYMRTYKPILAIIPPDGVAADILRQCRTAFISDSDDVGSIKEGISSLYSLWQENKLHVTPDVEFISKFNRKALTGFLADLFDEILTIKKPRD